MQRMTSCCLIALFLLGCTEPPSFPGATGADPVPLLHGSYAGTPVTLSAWGTSVVDGVLSPGEWDGAARVDFEANLPLTEGGGTTPATLFVMNDDRNLFIAVRVARHRANTTLTFNFDNDHDDADGSSYVREEGDDAIRAFVTESYAAFSDGFWTALPPCPVSWCGFADHEDFEGVPLGGTQDGAAAASSDGLVTYVELSHPLDSDDSRDFSLAFGATVGFHHWVRFEDLSGTWPDMVGDTDFPGVDYRPGWGDIVIASPPPDVAVALLQADVSALVDDGALRAGPANGLLALLGKALEDLEADRPDLAVARLRSFVRVVESLVQGGHLTADLAEPLIADAEQVITQIDEPEGPSPGGFTLADLGTLGGTNSVAHAVNNLGQVVGNSRLANGEEHAFLWENGVMVDLGTLGGTGSQALGINDRGQIVGRSTLANGDLHAFLWEDGTMTDLGTLAGTFSAALAINDRGQVAGFSTLPNGDIHAFLWQDGVMTDLGTLGGTRSLATGINDFGQVVGQSTLANGDTRAYVWQDGTMIGLGTLGGAWGAAEGVNELGQVVGWSRLADEQTRATLWTRHGARATP